MSRACESVNIARATAYVWRDDDVDFARQWDEVIEAAADDLEEEARRRAFKGLMRKKFTRGGDPIIDPDTGEQYSEIEYSDTLLIVLLKAHKPDKYRERVDQNIELRGGIPALTIVCEDGTNGTSSAKN